MFTTQRRLLLLGTACLVMVGAFATGCASGSETVSSTATNTDGESTNPAAISETTSPALAPDTIQTPTIPATAPVTTIPAPNTVPTPPTPTIPTTGPAPAVLDCGTIYRASGWPTTMVPSRETIRCLQTAFDGGTPARLVDREQTDGYGGAILVTTYETLGPRRVRVTVDATEAADRPHTTTITECAVLTTQVITITVTECTAVGS